MYRELAPGDFRWRGNLADARPEGRGICQVAAAEHYRAALEQAAEHPAINPYDAVAESLRALYHARVGEPDAARQRLQRALTLDPVAIEVICNEVLVATILANDERADVPFSAPSIRASRLP